MVERQIGPPPGPRASPGLVIQYSSMRSTRLRTLVVDHTCNLLESCAALAVKAMLCAAIGSGAAAAGTVCWRHVFMPLWCAR